MQFADILSDFEIIRIYETRNTVLGKIGYLFQLKSKVAYLYTDLATQEDGWIFIDRQKLLVGKREIKKIQSLMRLSNVDQIKVRSRDFIIYSRMIERAMTKLIDQHPKLERGSSHMAFAPKNYTRFSENLLFDFNYRYPEMRIVEIIENFDVIYRDTIQHQMGMISEGRDWDDDILYRYLTEFLLTHKQSINGQIYLPTLFFKIFDYFLVHENDKIALDMGPRIIIIRTSKENFEIFNTSSQSTKVTLQEKGYQIIEFSNMLLDQLLE